MNQPNPRESSGPDREYPIDLPPADRRELQAAGAKPARGLVRPAPNDKGEMAEVGAVIAAFRRRWMVAVGVGILLAVAVTPPVYLMMPERKYYASVILEVNPNAPIIAFDTRLNERVIEFKSYQKAQERLLRSEEILKAALAIPAVVKISPDKNISPDDPTEAGRERLQWLKESISVDYQSNLMIVTVEADEASHAETLVDALCNAYLNSIETEGPRDHENYLTKLTDIASNYNERLRRMKIELRALSEDVGTSDVKTSALKHQMMIEYKSLAEKELLTLRSELRKTEAAYEVARGRQQRIQGEPVPEDDVRRALAADPGVQQYFQRIRSLEENQRKGERLARNPKLDPAVSHWKREIAQVQRDLADYTTRLRPVVEARLREESLADRRAGESDPELLRRELEFLRQYESSLCQEIESLRGQVEKFGEKTIEIETVRDEIDKLDDLAAQVNAEVEKMTIEQEAPPRVTRRKGLDHSASSSEKKRLAASGLAAAGSFAFALVGITWWEYRARRIHCVDEVARGLGLRLVGTLPEAPRAQVGRGQSGGSARLQVRRQQELLESVDSTRTTLLHLARAEGLKVVMVTSAVGGEGKSSLSAHLAGSLARSGRRTLLIDCDLRRPTLHRLFELPLGPGLCDTLRGEATVEEAIRPTPLSDLWLLAAGENDLSALRAIAQDGVAEVLDPIRPQFDFIIVDSAPVLPVSDSQIVSQQVDGVIFSILREVSRVPDVQAAHERLDLLRARILGAVVNAAPTPKDRYGYSYASSR